MKKTNKLPKAFKRKWVKALRSGKFEQGKHSLKKRTDDGYAFCCLGVACEISGVKITMKHDPGFIEGSEHVRGISKIPLVLRGNDGVPGKLGEMNDGGRSFREIAEYIEQNL